MSHDTDKLIRQLSLVAFLMAERRPLTARDIKSSVEGYQEMSDEAFARDVADREQLHGELRRMAESVAGQLARSGKAARTVTTKLRYPDFSIRTRSTTLEAGCVDGERIGELACALLDRALRERPGALRLVGVSVSNLETHYQLALDAG